MNKCGKGWFFCVLLLVIGCLVGVVIIASRDDSDGDGDASAPTASQCVNGGGIVSANGEFCYTPSNQLRAWVAAAADCVNKGGLLAKISSAADNNAILNVAFRGANPTSAAWLGLNDRAQEGRFVWADDSVLTIGTDYSNFASARTGGSNTNASDCVAIVNTTGFWEPRDCGSQLSYVCQQSIAQRPSAPLSPSAADQGQNTIRVSFTQPADDGGAAITSYRVTANPAAPGGDVTTTSLSADVPNLVIGTTYNFTVVAVNKAGVSPPSTPSNNIAPEGVAPGDPTGLGGVEGNTVVTLSWTAPTNTGGAGVIILNYEITVTGPSSTSTVTAQASPYVVTGLTNGNAYSFTIKTVNQWTNANGALTSLKSTGASFGSFTPQQARPSEPRNLAVTAPSPLRITATYIAPQTSLTAVTGYTVILRNNATGATVETRTVSSSTLTVNFDFLSPSVLYFVEAYASNDAGSGSAAFSSPISPTATVPIAPTSSSAALVDGGVRVTFSLIDSPAACTCLGNGGMPILYYTVRANVSTGFVSANGTTSPIIFTGLSAGQGYTFQVAGVNALGVGAYTTDNTVITVPKSAPGSPSITSVTAGNIKATLMWTVPSTGGEAITNYTIRAQPPIPGKPDGVVVSSAAASCTTSCMVDVTGLMADVTYNFTVAARNLIGLGQPSAVSTSVTPFAVVPSAPTGVVATASKQQISVAFTETHNGGAPVISFTVSAINGNTVINRTGVVSPIVFQAKPIDPNGITTGVNYVFRVFATNRKGHGPTSATTVSGVAALPGAPDPPFNLTATGGNAQGTVSWTTPTNDGGSPVLFYIATTNPGALTANVSHTTSVAQYSATVAGLTNGVDYTFTVEAYNALGSSLPSTSSNSIRPKGGDVDEAEISTGAKVAGAVVLSLAMIGLIVGTGYCYMKDLYCFYDEPEETQKGADSSVDMYAQSSSQQQLDGTLEDTM